MFNVNFGCEDLTLPEDKKTVEVCLNKQDIQRMRNRIYIPYKELETSDIRGTRKITSIVKEKGVQGDCYL